MTLRLLAIDFGGTKLAAAEIDVTETHAELVASRQAPTPGDASSSLAVIWRMAAEVTADCPVDGVGVSFGGPVDSVRGVVRSSLHVEGWADYPLAEEMSTRYGVPCAVVNDGNAGALGEQRWGAGRGMSDVLYVTVSTGVGAGLVLRGRVHAGAHGLSGELGHLLVAEDGPGCSCGRRGCLEAFASGPAIARAARQAVESGRHPRSVLRARAGDDLAAVDARLVAELAREGDELALDVLAGAGHALGIGLAATVVICDPAVVVLGGGVVKSGEALLGPARAVLRQRAFGEAPELLLCALGPEAPLYGAAAAVADLITGR